MGKSAQGSIVSFDEGKTSSFTEIGDLGDFDWGGGSVNMLDDTPLSSMSEIKKPGLITYGTVSLTFSYDVNDAGQNALNSAFEGGTLSAFKVEYNDQITPTTGNNTSVTCDVYVSAFKRGSGSKDSISKGSATLTIVSKPVDTPAT